MTLSFTNSGCRVPLDIVELILGEVALFGDTILLQSCSVVCHDFTHICRQYLFKSITVSATFESSSQKTSLNRFYKVLKRNPTIGEFVRSLCYSSRSVYSRELPVLRRLHNVESFCLCSHSWDTFVVWSEQPSSFKAAFFSFIRSNRITRLTLSRIQGFPWHAIGNLPCLKELTLDKLTIGELCPLHQHPSPALEVLNLKYGSLDAMRIILGSSSTQIIDISALKTLQAHFEVDEQNGMDVVQNILKGSHTLETLMLQGT